MQTAATGGQPRSPGSGCLAFAASDRTLPGVSAPSRVVRSTIEIAVSMAHALAVVLIDRVPSIAARDSAPTWSTPGSPCRNARNAASERVTSRYGPVRTVSARASSGSASGSSTWVMSIILPRGVSVLVAAHSAGVGRESRTSVLVRDLVDGAGPVVGGPLADLAAPIEGTRAQ